MRKATDYNLQMDILESIAITETHDTIVEIWESIDNKFIESRYTLNGDLIEQTFIKIK